RHTQQYFEILGNRAMYKDGWLACWRLDRIPWKIDPETLKRFAPGKWDPDKDKCELYNLDEDFSQANDVADKYPDKVRDLTALFGAEAEKYQVLPLLGEMATVWGFPKGLPEQTKFTYYNGTENISSGMIPPIYNRSYSISADLDNPGRSGLGLRPGIAGVIVAEGSFLGGFSLYVENGYLKHTYSMLGLKLDTISSRDEVPKGKVNVRYEFTADTPGEFATGGTSRLFINGKQQAEGKLEHTVPFRFASYAGMDIGTDNGLPVVPKFEYAKVLPKYFRGTIEKVEFDLGPAKTSAKDLQRMYLERFARVVRNVETGRDKTPVDACAFNTPHFAKWLNTFVIGSLGMRITPPKGWSSSRIRKMAPVTENAEATRTSVVVAFGGASKLKPKKMTTSHETRMMSIGFEMDGIDCATSSDRS